MTFDEYVELQKENGDSFPGWRGHPAFYALQHGRYSTYLRPYLNLFGKSSIHIGFYEELQRDPLRFMASICRSAEIDESYFQEYQFGVANKGSDVRSRYLHKVYVETKEQLRKLVRRTPALRPVLRRAQSSVDSAYEKFNVARNRSVTMSAATRDFISSYYKDESARLREMLGIEVPWPSTCQAATAASSAAPTAALSRPRSPRRTLLYAGFTSTSISATSWRSIET